MKEASRPDPLAIPRRPPRAEMGAPREPSTADLRDACAQGRVVAEPAEKI